MTTVPGSVPAVATARRVSHVGTRPRSSGRPGKIPCGTTARAPLWGRRCRTMPVTASAVVAFRSTRWVPSTRGKPNDVRPEISCGPSPVLPYATFRKPISAEKGHPVLRNDLITHLSRTDNDSVVVNLNGVLIDVEGVKAERDSVVLVINRDDLLETLTKIADGRMPIQRA